MSDKALIIEHPQKQIITELLQHYAVHKTFDARILDLPQDALSLVKEIIQRKDFAFLAERYSFERFLDNEAQRRINVGEKPFTAQDRSEAIRHRYGG